MAKKPTQVPAKPGYMDTRFNATTHGILSRHTILPWEDSEEYRQLHEDLITEYAPAGPTQGHLVEEVAGIMWRKQRLRMAEAGAARQSLAQLATERGRPPKSVLPSIDLYESEDGGIDQELLSLVSVPPDQIENELAKIDQDLADTDPDETAFDKLQRKHRLLEQYHELHEAVQSNVTSGSTYEKIARYETQLDRKLERTLTMLLRIQEFRNRSAAAGTV